jgi:hypothetical protein
VGNKNTPQVPSSVTTAQTADENALTQIAQTQAANSQQLYNLTEPGIATAESFYGSLASGSPYAIQTAISPATQQIAQSAAGAKQNIMQNTPAGGTKNLALQQVDVAQGAQVGNTATQGYLGSFNALGQLGGQGVGLSQGAGGLAVSGLSSAGNISASQGQMSLEAQQMQLQQKGQTLGAFGGLAGDVATLGAAGIGSSGTKALAGALGGAGASVAAPSGGGSGDWGPS